MDPQYKTGHEAIDAQHEKLIATIEELTNKVGSRTVSHADVEELHQFLLNYASIHFAFEEELMQKHSYPEYENHVTFHKQFSRRLANLFAQGSDLNTALDVLVALNSWLMNHIKHEDKKVAQFVLNAQ